MTVTTFRDFGGPIPEKTPLPRRRFLLSLLLPATILAGGAGLIVYASLTNGDTPLPRPGPRRYPASYHASKRI
jgi:hypothetical protein